MASTIYESTDIHPESIKYSDKALCAYYEMHAPGARTKRCCLPEVRYLGSGSEEKALRIWITRIF